MIENVISIMSDMSEAERRAGLGIGYFPDEDPATTDPREASRWIRVYSELIRFKEEVLAAAHRAIARITDAVAREAAIEADLPILEGENQRLRQRLDFWKQRHVELELPAS